MRKINKDGEKTVLVKDNLQGFNRRTYYQTSRQKKSKKRIKLHRKHTSFNWLGEKKPQKYSQNIKLNETAKNVECRRLPKAAGCPEPTLTTKFQNHCDL